MKSLSATERKINIGMPDNQLKHLVDSSGDRLTLPGEAGELIGVVGVALSVFFFSI